MAILIGCCVEFSSCHKEDEVIFDKNGVAVRLPHLWKTSITKVNDNVHVVVATPIIYEEGKLLIGAGKGNGGDRTIMSINSADGKINWQWNDALSLISDPNYKDPIIIYAETFHLNENRLFFNYSTSSYCLDLSTGQTAWKYKTFRSRFSINSGIDNIYFTAGKAYGTLDEEKMYYGSLLSSDEEQLLLEPEFTRVENPVGPLGSITHITPFKDGSDTYLAFGIENPYTDFATKEGMGATELNLYNITQGRYEYKKVVVNPNRETRWIDDLFYQAPNFYFQTSDYIHAYEAKTGKEVWRTKVGSAPVTSRMILADNKLFSACEDRFLYCVDALTGRLLWKEQNTGTCSELSYLNGIVYYLGGGDGLLHAVDAETGKHLWKVSSPDFNGNSGAWFYGLCVAVPGKNGEKGVVVATTGLNAYGYEAIR